MCTLKYVRSLFTNIQKQWNMLKIRLSLGNLQTSQANNGQITREFLGLRMRNFQGTVFI